MEKEDIQFPKYTILYKPNNYEGYNVITYPYYSIWDQEEAKKAAPEMWKDMEMWIEMQELQQMKQQGD